MHSQQEDVSRHAIQQADVIAANAAEMIRVKYVAGQLEHGGNLFRKPVLHEAIAEAVDMFTYLHVLADQAGRALSLLDSYGERCTLPPEIRAARNILRYGNIEGEVA